MNIVRYRRSDMTTPHPNTARRHSLRPLWGAALVAVWGVCASAALALPPLLGLVAAPLWTALSLLRELYADLRILHLRGSFGFHK